MTTETSSSPLGKELPLLFEKQPFDVLFMYQELYEKKILEGSPMIDYYHNMLDIVNKEINRRAKKFSF
ncbi:hypothetical protein vBBceHLY2_00109 [Bacillus phage vB_BceH_LY2]|nr:hypothetical protein vBBceHLY2_00109 [Bacillus phage vB_BceH_LY2]